ncbi:uncharacterized protein LOC129633186 isoform X2 [Bubalus kerabau]|uniref:uncharacterized protein LOC129633186 isoform X2 n=1 Tax=Bubalus carabanensis TaxID=3119969 RepID=UPI00244EFB9D|nr:uncharacterized protein LOC129633186 isoform X2 [Bubalus carabanensis]
METPLPLSRHKEMLGLMRCHCGQCRSWRCLTGILSFYPHFLRRKRNPRLRGQSVLPKDTERMLGAGNPSPLCQSSKPAWTRLPSPIPVALEPRERNEKPKQQPLQTLLQRLQGLKTCLSHVITLICLLGIEQRWRGARSQQRQQFLSAHPPALPEKQCNMDQPVSICSSSGQEPNLILPMAPTLYLCYK